MTTPSQSKAEDLAREIMELSRNTLLVKLRFLEPAILPIDLLPNPETTYATDGFAIQYGFLQVLRSYQAEKELVMHDYLHMVLHHLFHHPFVGRRVDALAWDLACDIAVEGIIEELALPETECMRSDQQRMLLAELRQRIGVLTAERIYHDLTSRPLDAETLLTYREPFLTDDHTLWYQHSEHKEPGEDAIADEDKENADEDTDASGESGGDNQSGDAGEADGGGKDGPSEEENEQSAPKPEKDAAKQWQDIAARVQTDLETTSRRWAERAGSMLRNLREATMERQSYRAFLSQFMTLGEIMKINDAEFDYVYYTYGLKLYENVPLIEPLEYADEKRIRDLAIVLDTSASVDGSLVQSFVRKTWDILRSEDTFFREANLHLILCDAKVQGDYRIRTDEEVSEVLDTLELRGFGGTDFRPAFRYVDQLVDGQEFRDFRGLLYFTDGYGVFPEQRPNYEAAFVFLEQQNSPIDFESIKLPPWAIRHVITEEDLHRPSE